ncbi:MAG: hypothetical protein WCU80_08500 [Paludibacteraceae bacterium]
MGTAQMLQVDNAYGIFQNRISCFFDDCISGKLTYQGGLCYSPIDEAATRENYAEGSPDVVYDERNAYSKRSNPVLMLDLTVSFKLNRKSVSHEIALEALNILGQKVFYQHIYNYKEDKVEEYGAGFSFPNIYYRIFF